MKQSVKKFLFIPLFILVSSCDFTIPYINDYYNSSPAKTTSSSLISSTTSSTQSNSFNSSSNTPSISSPSSGEKEFDDVSVHFLELGNQYSGDSVYIKAGDTDILIDAGSRKNSAPTIANYINTYCTDGILEYVIATHAHQDHIAGFVGESENGTRNGIFYQYQCETIIDFAQADSTSQIYKDYLTARNRQVENGAKHYTSLECYNNANGAQRSYTIGKNVTLNILYQKYYEQKSSSGENDYSVCVLISQGNDNHFLFTGDLESSGEKSLVESNNLPHVKLFKGGHHGSGTSNTDTLLDCIHPENICICTCAGTSEYTSNKLNMFPYQETVNRMAKHTENIYVTSQVDKEASSSTAKDFTTKPMNGNIRVTSTVSSFTINCSNNNLKLKDTEWFKNNRTWPSK